MEKCCANCFSEPWLVDHIVSHGEKINKCNFCEGEGFHAISTNDFRKLIYPIISIYTPMDEYLSPKAFTGGMFPDDSMIWDRLTDDWGIFDDPEIGEKILSSIYVDDPRDGTEHGFMNGAVNLEEEWFGEDIVLRNKSGEWNNFCEEIMHKNRFSPHHFKENIIDKIISSNVEIVEEKTTLWRARILKGDKMYRPDEMGAPPPDRSTFGRMNPKGISYLYLSDDPRTCAYEVDCRLSDKIAIGKFSFKKECEMNKSNM